MLAASGTFNLRFPSDPVCLLDFLGYIANPPKRSGIQGIGELNLNRRRSTTVGILKRLGSK